MTTEGNVILATSDGNPVLNSQGGEIILWQRQGTDGGAGNTGDAQTNSTQNWSVDDIIVDESGQVLREVRGETTVSYDLLGRIGVAQFNNPSGLIKAGGSLLYESDASGAARIEGQDTGLKNSVVKQGYLEASNVQAVDEMVNMIVAQRAYELNSKIITASDEMLQQANNLRR